MIEKPALQLLEPALSEAERVFGGGKPAVVIFSPMRYLLKARVKPGKKPALIDAIDQQTLGRGSIAGDEYLHNMQQARVDDAGAATWVETCFCDPPLAEERPYWEEYFDLLRVKDVALATQLPA